MGMSRSLGAATSDSFISVRESPDRWNCPGVYLNVAMTTMSSAIDRLVKKMLVERRRPEDTAAFSASQPEDRSA
jgi:hypothetical protein